MSVVLQVTVGVVFPPPWGRRERRAMRGGVHAAAAHVGYRVAFAVAGRYALCALQRWACMSRRTEALRSSLGRDPTSEELRGYFDADPVTWHAVFAAKDQGLRADPDGPARPAD